MATIEERSEMYQKQKHNVEKTDYLPRHIGEAYRDGAKDQDRIARAEERERCINIAQEIVCKKCFDSSAIGCRCVNDVAKCELLIELRKAIEKVK